MTHREQILAMLASLGFAETDDDTFAASTSFYWRDGELNIQGGGYEGFRTTLAFKPDGSIDRWEAWE